MSRSANIALEWADGEYPFRLAIKQIEELQEKTDCGPYTLLQRISDGSWRLADMRETLRLGLIGGGMDPLKALGLVKRYVDDRPLLENIPHARAVLMAALMGAPDGEKPGKGAAARAKGRSKASPMENSPSPPITEPALP
jgi:hypothetical protein